MAQAFASLGFAIPSFTVPSTEAEARAEQDALRSRLILQDTFNDPHIIGGVDVGYDVAYNLAHASLVTLRLKDMMLLEQVQAFAPSEFPYITGLLAFREIPAILAALAKLQKLPDIWMVDGQGIAHPRRMGIASHLGILLDMPAFGVGKSRLTGRYKVPAELKGSYTPLMASNTEQLGYVVRSRDRVKPLFISPGHRISMESVLNLTLRCLTRYRLPEPTRLADKLSKVEKTPVTQLQFL